MSEASFRTDLRYAVRGLWQGVITRPQFTSQVNKVLQKELTRAWIEGARDCGVSPDELTEDELKAREDFISNQVGFIEGFAEAIRENNKKSGGDIFPLFERAKKWLERYPEAKANGHAMACADQKAEFFYGKTREHCSTCRGLVGRVYRYSTWIKYNAVPPHNWNFACRGGCQCQLRTTDKPITKGRFPVGLLA